MALHQDQQSPASARLHLTQRPSRVRYLVIVFAVTLSVITYIDRVCISVAAPKMTEDLRLSSSQMGWAFFAFTWAYALFEIPGGFLGDWMGARKVLMRIVIWWSVFTALTGAVWNWASLLATRALFGMGEAGAFPNMTKMFMTWLPQEERVRAQGIMWLSARWGGAFTPLLVVWILKYMTWRQSFMVFGCLGSIWAVFYFLWYRDDPRDNKKVNAAELALMPDPRVGMSHAHVPWGKFVRSKQVWLLCAQYFCLSYGWYFYITWLPTYLQKARHLELGKGALLASLPLFLGGIGSMFSGSIAPWVTRLTGSTAKTRRLMAYIGFAGASGLLFLSSQLQDATLAMIAMGFASFSNDLAMPGAWGACMDVGGKYAGTLSGTMNMMGNFGGALSPVVIGYILDLTGNWQLPFYVSCTIYFMGVFCWMGLDPVTPLDEDAAAR